MIQARQFSIYVAITFWAVIVGGVVYSHVVYFPPYLSHLPESNSLINGDYGLQESQFWLFIHPLAILSTVLTLILNWKLKTRRKFILISLGIYVVAIIATAVYFVPGLIAFAGSTNNTSITPAEWYHRGQTWQHLSWIRGSFIYIGFIMLVISMTKDTAQNSYAK